MNLHEALTNPPEDQLPTLVEMIEAAELLRDQLTFLINNHYQRD